MKKENILRNPRKVQIMYIHMKNTCIKIYKKWNINKHKNEKYTPENT